MIRMRLAPWSALVWLAALATTPLAQQRDTTTKLFPPEQLVLLEAPDRDEWQQPDRIMDRLSIADGARVADIGAGGGWFTIRLARRVGPNGRVFAEDIQPPMIESIKRRVEREGLNNVTTVLGSTADARLTAGLEVALIVDTYPQFRDPVGLLRNVAAALVPGGRLGIVDFKTDGAGGPGPPLEERLNPDVIRRRWRPCPRFSRRTRTPSTARSRTWCPRVRRHRSRRRCATRCSRRPSACAPCWCCSARTSAARTAGRCRPPAPSKRFTRRR
jgi:SAM-dependent methyltransferase